MSESKAYDKLFYPGLNVLKNKFDIRESTKLKIAEETAVAARMFKMNVLQLIHLKSIISIQ